MYFKYKSVELVDKSKKYLIALSKELKKLKPYIKKVIIYAHTDSIGSKKYNKKLSQKRADAVKEYLISLGISPLLIEAKGMGEEYPIASNKTAEGRAKNRRVEIEIKLKGE